MGFSIKFNWVLQFDPPHVVVAGQSYPFQKTGNRVFPIQTPIDLIDSERIALAKIKVRSFTNSSDGTTGVFEVLKVYDGEEKSVLSNYWLENE